MFSTPDVEQRLRETEGRSLSTWSIGPEAMSPEVIALRKVLNERYLEPFMTTQVQYKVHLESFAHGISVRSIKGVPILLFAGGCLKRKTISSSAGCLAHVISAVCYH